MDNLSSQKGGRVSELIEERGCELVVYLHRPTRRRTSTPSRRPLCQSEGVAQGDRGAHSRSFGGEALGRTLDAVTARDARGFFEHCGYRVTGQLL
jgi:hypothetical protein